MATQTNQSLVLGDVLTGAAVVDIDTAEFSRPFRVGSSGLIQGSALPTGTVTLTFALDLSPDGENWVEHTASYLAWAAAAGGKLGAVVQTAMAFARLRATAGTDVTAKAWLTSPDAGI